jgi:hypothetical protein
VTRFYLDKNIAEALSSRLVALGHDAVTTNALRRKGAKDHQQVLFAAEQHRTLVTSNSHDFRLLHEAWRDWSAAWGTAPEIARHAGIMLIPQNETGLTVARLAKSSFTPVGRIGGR